MSTQTVHMQGHQAFPLTVEVAHNTASGRFTVTVAINGTPIHTESNSAGVLTMFRANFLFQLWSQNLHPIFDAGLIAGINFHDKESRRER